MSLYYFDIGLILEVTIAAIFTATFSAAIAIAVCCRKQITVYHVYGGDCLRDHESSINLERSVAFCMAVDSHYNGADNALRVGIIDILYVYGGNGTRTGFTTDNRKILCCPCHYTGEIPTDVSVLTFDVRTTSFYCFFVCFKTVSLYGKATA